MSDIAFVISSTQDAEVALKDSYYHAGSILIDITEEFLLGTSIQDIYQLFLLSSCQIFPGFINLPVTKKGWPRLIVS